MAPNEFDIDAEPPFLDQLAARLDAAEVIAFDSRHRRKDGNAFPVEVRIRSFWQGGSRFAVSWFGILPSASRPSGLWSRVTVS